MNLTLYGLDKTRSMRPRWLMEELNLEYNFVEINIFKGEGLTSEYKQIHPFGQVPALEADGNTIFESGAICHWLTDQFIEQGLAPNLDSPQRLEYEQWMFFSPATLEPAAFNYLLHTKILPENKRIKEVADWNQQQYISRLGVLNQLLANREYLIDNRFSTADIMLAYLLFWFPEMLTEFSTLQAYCERLSNRKAYLKIK